MHTVFHNLNVQGFKSIIQPISIDLDQSGLHFLKAINLLHPQLGSNDSGKSTLWQALTWGLYGRTADNLRNPDVRPWPRFGYDGPTQVIVQVSCDGMRYVVIRTASPNHLSLDGFAAGQPQIDELIGLDFELFVNTVLFGQARPLFFDLTAGKKLDLLVPVLKLDRWDARSEHAATRARQVEDDLVRLAAERAGLEQKLRDVTDDFSQCEVRWSEWEARRNSRDAEIGAEIKELEQRLIGIQRRRDDADLALDGAGTELKALDNQLRIKRAELAELENLRNAEQTEFDRISRETSTAQGALARFTTGDNCPTCGQALRGTALEKHRRKMERELVVLRADLQRQGPAYQRMEDLVDQSNAEIERLEQSLQQFTTAADDAQTTLNLTVPLYTALETRVSMLRQQKDSGSAEVNPHGDYLKQLRDIIAQTEIAQIEAEERRIGLDRYLARVNFWVKAFKDVKLQVLDDVLLDLEMTTNGILAASGLDGWQVFYEVERETKSGTIKRELNVSILSPEHPDPVRWEAWGGGVGQRLRVIGALALSEVLLGHAGVTTNLTVLDEPTRHMSPEGVGDLVELLADRAGDGQTVWLVDHIARESGRFASVLALEKDAGGTRLAA